MYLFRAIRLSEGSSSQTSVSDSANTFAGDERKLLCCALKQHTSDLRIQSRYRTVHSTQLAAIISRYSTVHSWLLVP